MKAFWTPVCLLVSLMALWAGYSVAQEESDIPSFAAFKPIAENKNDDELRKLLKARYNESIQEVKTNYRLIIGGKMSLDGLLDSGQRLVLSGLEVLETKAEKVALLTQYVDLAKLVEKWVEEKVSGGVESTSALHRARHARLEAEIQLVRAKREK